MAIHFETTIDGTLLRVTTRGKDDGLDGVVAYAEGVAETARLRHCTRILCDERGLTYDLSTMDTYAAAEAVSKYSTSISRIAIVCRPEFLEAGIFFENVAANRGLQLRMFTDIGEAERWLSEGML